MGEITQCLILCAVLALCTVSAVNAETCSTAGDVQLVGGPDDNTGFLEVCDGTGFVRVCFDTFGANSAEFVCQQLNIPPPQTMIPTAYIAPGSDMVDSVNYDCVQGVDFDECFTPVAGETCPPVSISCLGDTNIISCEDGVKCVNGECMNTAEGFECICGDGFTPVPVDPTDDPLCRVCRDIDECVEEQKMEQCAPNGKCRDDEGTYTCVCDVGFKLTADGTTCEVECENGVDSTSCPEGENCVENEDGIFACEADRKTGSRKTGSRKRGSKKGKSKSRRN
jgi:hypothetical protein